MNGLAGLCRLGYDALLGRLDAASRRDPARVNDEKIGSHVAALEQDLVSVQNAVFYHGPQELQLAGREVREEWNLRKTFFNAPSHDKKELGAHVGSCLGQKLAKRRLCD